MCAEAEHGFYLVGDWEFECEEGSLLWLVQGAQWLAVLTVWIGINEIASGEYDALDLFLQFIQISFLISLYGLRWHPRLASVLTLLAVANFDVDFVSPACVLPEWSRAWSFYLQLALPFLAGAAYELWDKLRQLRGGWKQATIFRPGVFFQKTFQMFLVMYHVILIKCLNVFDCTLEPGCRQNFVVQYPEVLCGSPDHWRMQVTAGVFLVVVVVGVPCALALVLMRGYSTEALDDPGFFTKFGFLYSRY